MGYQALLFCPDEKTARTVTQVLSELDFEVTPCTEPFAAVKKLMAEHFDAVVVDCDNEQNATLLYKSARNAPNNHSALAVAVVEGQAGVAKAFRIGANLVLTKPINVEQAKGTLRVARGLLRKNETTKTTPSTAAAIKPAVSTTTKAIPAPLISDVNRPADLPVTAAAPRRIPTPEPTPGLDAAYATAAIQQSAEIKESLAPVTKQTSSPVIATPIVQASASAASLTPVESKPDAAPNKAENQARSNSGFASVGSSGAASAPAPALEPKPAAESRVEETSTSLPETGKAASEVALGESSETKENPPAPLFTLGGSEDAAEPSRGSKKALLAVAAVIVVAAGGYAAWTQYGPSLNPASSPASVAVHQATSSIPSPSTSTPVNTPSPSINAPSLAEPVSSPASSITTVDVLSSQTAKPKVTSPAIPGTQKSNAVLGKSDFEIESAKSAPPVSTEKQSAATSPLMIKNGSTNAAPQKQDTTDAPAPSISTIASSSNNSALPNLMNTPSSAPAPVLQSLSISQGVSQGLLIKKTSPVYPANAMRLRIEGPVTLLATISKTGNISAIKILSGDPGLARAAADAVKQWKYKPYLLDGAPVEIQTQVTVNFKLPN
jgi:TonB family protein